MHDSLRLIVPVLPQLDDPLVIAAFWGRGDRTGSATQAIRYLRDAWSATELATVDPDRFYDLSVTRPRVRQTDAGPVIRWPGTRFDTARPRGSKRDVVLLSGREAHLRWIEYAELVADFMHAVGATRFLTLGTRPVYMPHTRPAPLVLADADEDFQRLFPLPVEPGRTEGPANLQTVVMLHLRGLGISAARLIAMTPGYINGGPQPRAMIALVEQLDPALGTSTAVESLRDAIAGFEQQVLDSADKVEDMRTKLRELEEQYDASLAANAESSQLPNADELVRGIEDLLRKHGDNNRPGSRGA